MSNPLTGDFDAVLQVSGGTVNRLLASMHQNAFAKTDLPSFPHSIWIRIGDTRAVDGVRGTVQGQIGVPRVELIHGVSDRFILEVGVRALFRPDTGSTPFPNFIHGTVRAEYRIRNIDPHCFGWSAQSAGKYLWVHVVKDSVRFTGTAQDDRNPAIGVVTLNAADTAADQAAKEAAITRQAAYLLAKQFAAAPHPVSARFRPGSMRSLKAPIGGSAVALPLALRGEPVGNIGTINNLLLEESDFAIGVNLDYILSLAGPALEEIKKPIPSIPIHIHVDTAVFVPDIDFSTVYRVHIDPATVEWLPFGSHAVIRIKFSGSAKTDSVAPNATFDVSADILFQFDAVNERLFLAPGASTVTPHVSGLASGLVKSFVKSEIEKKVTSVIGWACAQAQPSLDSMISRKQELIDQLRTLDGKADARVDQALFLRDGIILRGTIPLTARPWPVGVYEKTLDKNGFTALQSWIPGGRIDHLEWSWTWFSYEHPPGAATHDDRFVLRRPGGSVSRWGMGINLSMPLPGLDGGGTLCLKVKGVQVDADTGEFVPVESVRRCQRFGIDPSIYLRSDRGRLFLYEPPQLARDVPFPQLAIRGVEGAPRSSAANTLLLYADRGWDPEVGATLRAGLEGTMRHDAGLLLLLLFREGALGHRGSGFVREIEELGQRIGIASIVSEDIRGCWNRAFALDAGSGELAWRLLSPGGGVTWMHRGRLSPKHLTEALDHYLIPSARVEATPLQHDATIGSRISIGALYADLLDEDPTCPPPPLGRIALVPTVIAFVQSGSESSTAQLRSLSAQYGQQRDDGPAVVVVVDGVDAHETERMKNELGFDFTTLPDPRGELTNKFGIRFWPTTMMIEPGGLISAIEIGSPEHYRTDDSRQSAT